MGNGAIEAGMPKPPRFVRRTEEQVSALLIKRIGSARIEIDATLAARFAPVARAIAPGAYKRGVLRTAAPQQNPRQRRGRHRDD
jgi:hypothetical protein